MNVFNGSKSITNSFLKIKNLKIKKIITLIIEIVCSFGPLIKIVHDLGFLTPSMKVNLSSPNEASSTESAHPFIKNNIL